MHYSKFKHKLTVFQKGIKESVFFILELCFFYSRGLCKDWDTYRGIYEVVRGIRLYQHFKDKRK